MRAKFEMLFQNFWGKITCKRNTQCRKFFECRDKAGKDFWNRLGREHPCCECEDVSVSEYSPGPFKDDETLLSVVPCRRYMSSDDRVEPMIFDSRMSDGKSTDRKKYTTLQCYDLRARKLAEGNPKKENCGSIELSVRNIRNIDHEGMRAIAVYDTALPQNMSHAEIACTEVPPKGTDDRKRHRAKLRRDVLKATLHDGRVLKSSELFGNQKEKASQGYNGWSDLQRDW